MAAQFVHRRLETQARARGRLEKQRRQFLAVAFVRVDVRMRDDVLGDSDQRLDLIGRQILDVDQTSHIFSLFPDPALVRRAVAERDQSFYVLRTDIAFFRCDLRNGVKIGQTDILDFGCR